jgi:ATP-dependent DNA helicase PIF1
MEKGVVLNELQRKVYDKVLRGENIFMTGSGGVGKSFTIKEICDALERRNVKFAVTASTGAAAILINGQTIHRWSGCGVFGASAEVLAKQILDDPKKKIPNVNWTTTKVLIIDEISMIDGSVFDKLEYVARMVRKNPRPFGGMQVVICGDFAQLPPVKPEGGYCFQAKSWGNVISYHNMIELTEVIRQSEVAFRKALCEIRMGKVSSDTVALLRSRIGAKVGTDMIKPTVFLSRREEVLKKNTEELDRIPMSAIPFAARDFFFPYTPSPTDNAKYIEEANKNLQPVQLLHLKVGAQVMLIFNRSDTLVNGSRGVVTAFQAGLPIVQFMSGETLIIEKHKWKVKMTDKLYLEREQIPLILSWAITIHKCVSENTMIVTSKGVRYIGEYVTESTKPGWTDLQNLDVMTMSGWSKATKLYNGETEPSIKITTALGYYLEGSIRHPVLTCNENGQEIWKLLPDITIGDVVIMRRGVTYEKIEPLVISSFYTERIFPAKIINCDLAWLFGFIVGDGSYRNKEDGTVDVTNNDESLLHFFHTICERDLNVRVCSYKKNRKYFCNLGARKFLLACGMNYTLGPQKSVPWVILQSPPEIQAAFLSGLYDADGGVHKVGIHLTTSSTQMANEVHVLLLNLGILSGLYEMPNNKNGAWRIEIQGQEQLLFRDKIGFRSQDKQGKIVYQEKQIPKRNLGGFPDSQKIATEFQKYYENRMPRKVRKFISRVKCGTSRLHDGHFNFLQNFIDLNVSDVGREILRRQSLGYLYLPILQIEQSSCKMIDIEVPDTHSFISNGFISHNCQGATVDCAEIDIGSSFEHGQAYVALSRVRSLEGLSLRGGDLSRITVHPLVKKFYEALSGPSTPLIPSAVATSAPAVGAAVQLKSIEKKRLPTEDLKDPREDETKKQNKTE